MRKKIPLIVENYPDDYTGYPFITLIQYNKQQYLTIINEICEEEVSAYVLDYCGAETVPQDALISLAEDWFNNHHNLYPFSIHLSKNNLTPILSPIHRVFSIEYITRIIGPLFDYSSNNKQSIRRRKKKDIPLSIEVIKH